MDSWEKEARTWSKERILAEIITLKVEISENQRLIDGGSEAWSTMQDKILEWDKEISFLKSLL
ncbi:hypothetical protein CEE37_07750 [candidate division LCP-89 bacterium B3_LCP]|uniref:Uncharacterized protein n=1 Tax=candidate division LCP-89 bacterium B3_LCP TaxID=2012998 RepID=A0A532V1J2_UNCL8|nr:MAG: hypothetical protein CEE37_07750 [candidate division LCP-89 bacterium B3_LCP]